MLSSALEPLFTFQLHENQLNLINLIRIIVGTLSKSNGFGCAYLSVLQLDHLGQSNLVDKVGTLQNTIFCFYV